MSLTVWNRGQAQKVWNGVGVGVRLGRRRRGQGRSRGAGVEWGGAAGCSAVGEERQACAVYGERTRGGRVAKDPFFRRLWKKPTEITVLPLSGKEADRKKSVFTSGGN
jgi:hypothetical protein